MTDVTVGTPGRAVREPSVSVAGHAASCTHWPAASACLTDVRSTTGLHPVMSVTRRRVIDHATQWPDDALHLTDADGGGFIAPFSDHVLYGTFIPCEIVRPGQQIHVSATMDGTVQGGIIPIDIPFGLYISEMHPGGPVTWYGHGEVAAHVTPGSTATVAISLEDQFTITEAMCSEGVFGPQRVGVMAGAIDAGGGAYGYWLDGDQLTVTLTLWAL